MGGLRLAITGRPGVWIHQRGGPVPEEEDWGFLMTEDGEALTTEDGEELSTEYPA